MMFKLGSTDFEIDESESCFYIDRENDMIQFSLDISTKDKEYHNEKHAPSIDIRWFETRKNDISELIGMEVTVSTIEESDEREDTFYLYEHEPFVKYRLNIINTHNESIHISMKGIVVEDGYAKPYTTETLDIDCWLRISYI